MIRDGLRVLANAAGMNAFARSRNASRFRILAYHGVDARQDPVANYDGFQVDPAIFRTQLEWLKKKYAVVSLQEVCEALVHDRSLPRHAVVITFDDGYLNNLEMAVPMLKEFNFPSTAFVTTGFVAGTHLPWWYGLRYRLRQTEKPSCTLLGLTFRLDTPAQRARAVLGVEGLLRLKSSAEQKEALRHLNGQLGVETVDELYPLMNPDQVKKIASLGVDVQPHTVSHISLAHEDLALVGEELDVSINKVREWTCVEPYAFAYPYGSLKNIGGDRVRRELRERRIRLAVTTIPGLNHDHTNPWMLHRLNITSNHTLDRFKTLMSGLWM